MSTNGRRKPPEISDFPPEEISSTVLLLLEICHEQQQEIEVLRDEIARLKGGNPKPPIKPSKLESNKDGAKKKTGKSRGKNKRRKTHRLKIHDESVVSPATTVPTDSRSPAQRERGLHLVVNNARFLILPWVRCRNLASALLARAAQRIGEDFPQRYGYRPVLLETFVEQPRFRGTAYRAANWQCVGESRGRGRLDVHHHAALPRKLVYIYPLQRDCRGILCADNPQR